MGGKIKIAKEKENYSSLNRLPRAGEGIAEINDRGDVGREDEGKDDGELDSASKSARCSLKGLPGKEVEPVAS